MENSKLILDELGKVSAQFKGVLDTVESHKNLSGEQNEKLDRMNDRIDELEAKLKAPNVADETKAKDEKLEMKERKMAAFNSYLRKGLAYCSPEERKLLTAGDDTTGGYLTGTDDVREIVKSITEFSPIRSIAKVRATDQRSVRIRKRTGTFSAVNVGETETRTETTGLTWGLIDIPAHEIYALVDVSTQDLDDSLYNLQAEINMEAGEQFGVKEGSNFVNGTGVQMAEGFMVNGDIGTTNSGNASALTADGFINLYYAIKTGYAKNGTWTLNRTTLRDVRKLKDGSGAYIWERSYQVGQPERLLGASILEVTDMADVAANAYPVAFGDFKRGYQIVDRQMISILRDDYTQAASGAVRYHFKKRVGGAVILPEAIRKMKISV